MAENHFTLGVRYEKKRVRLFSDGCDFSEKRTVSEQRFVLNFFREQKRIAVCIRRGIDPNSLEGCRI